MNYFSKNILYLRKKRGITQAQIPNFIDIERGTWSNYEVGRTEPSLDQIIAIARFLEVSIDDLLLKNVEAEGKVNENAEVDESGKVNGKGIGKVYSNNEAITLAAEPGDLTINSSHKEVIDTINKMRRTIEEMQRLNGK